MSTSIGRDETRHREGLSSFTVLHSSTGISKTGKEVSAELLFFFFFSGKSGFGGCYYIKLDFSLLCMLFQT